jgi:hypothetical protein
LLVELLVALALLGVVGAVASGLLVELAHLDAALARTARLPLLDPALARLRNDIQSAVRQACRQHGHRCRWSCSSKTEAGSATASQRTPRAPRSGRRGLAVAARGQRRCGRGWRWRAVGPRLLVVEIEAWSVRRAGAGARAGGGCPSEPTVRELLWVALRGGGGRRAW